MTIYENVKPIDLNAIETYNLASRPSKVTIKDFATPFGEHESLRGFLTSFRIFLRFRICELSPRVLGVLATSESQ